MRYESPFVTFCYNEIHLRELKIDSSFTIISETQMQHPLSGSRCVHMLPVQHGSHFMRWFTTNPVAQWLYKLHCNWLVIKMGREGEGREVDQVMPWCSQVMLRRGTECVVQATRRGHTLCTRDGRCPRWLLCVRDTCQEELPPEIYIHSWKRTSTECT